jgi:hypothetical protein
VAAEDLQLDRITSLSKALDRVPQGKAAFELARRLGLVSTDHDFPEGREAFPTTSLGALQRPDLRPARLLALRVRPDPRARRAAAGPEEARRPADEVCGGLRPVPGARNWPDDAKKPTQGELNDRAEEDPT